MLTAPQGCPWHSARRGVSHPAPSSSRVAILSRKMRAAVGLFLPIAAAILGCWWWLGAPVAMPPSPLDAGEKLFCVSYTPFRGNQTPLDLTTRIDAGKIEDDLARLARLSGCVRTYSRISASTGLPRSLGATACR